MDTAKIKNFIIILLLVVNLFLLGIVMVDRNDARTARADAQADITKILSGSGITLSDDADLSPLPLYGYSLKRDLDSEAAIVRRLLGEVSAEALGGNIMFYNGENGQARFRGNGEFDFSLNVGAIATGGDPEKTARGIMEKLKLTPGEVSTLDAGSDYTTLTLSYTWEASPVFGNGVTFTFSGNSLLLISGRRALDSSSPQTAERSIDMITALMRFLDFMNSEGHVFNEIRAFDSGYVMSTSLADSSTLIPVWRIETDVGEFFINGLTGRHETLY